MNAVLKVKRLQNSEGTSLWLPAEGGEPFSVRAYCIAILSMGTKPQMGVPAQTSMYAHWM